MRLLWVFFISLWGVVALFQAPLPADEITWLVTEWPPFQYREGGEYKGYAIELQRLVEARMPEYTHRTITANFARIAERIKNGNNACAFGMYKNPEREQYGYFTIPDLLFFPNVVFMSKELHGELGEPVSISLRGLLKDDQKKLLLPAKRKFGPVIDKIIRETRAANNVEYVFTGDFSKNIFRRLTFERIDYTIEYPIEGKFIAAQLGAEDKVVSVMIEEGRTLLYSHTLCPKTPWGLKTVNAINRALLKIRPTEAYRKAYEQRLEEHLIPVYRKAYDDIFLNETE
ncbi:MAG: TIGR02285 family protein [Desulfobacteraceae bacterium]|nr:TIGR02285 family protein [Desulfobacteraceae bacterium]